MDTTKRIRTFSSMSDVMKRAGITNYSTLNTIQVISAGHIVHLPIDGTAVNLDVSTGADLKSFARCPKCARPFHRSLVHCPEGDFIAQRCMNTICRIERENNQVRRADEEKCAEHAEKTLDGSFMGRFGVPQGYFHCEIGNYRNHEGFTAAGHCAAECRSFIDGPFRTLLLTGNTGTGKTHIAVGVLRAFAERGKTSLRFEPVSMMMSQFKKSYGGGEGEKSEYDRIHEYAGINVLVLDDLGTENITENSVSLVSTIIEQRIASNRRTILTSNFGMKRLEQIYGSRLVSRLSGETGKVLHITGPDYRKRTFQTSSKF